jgi:hypothetical protein
VDGVRRTIFRGWALARQGREAEGISDLRFGLAAWQRTGGGVMLPQCLGWLAEALGRIGRVDEGPLRLRETRAPSHGSCVQL